MTTHQSANSLLHELGLPGIGLTRLSMEIGVTVSIEEQTDPVANPNDLLSHEEAFGYEEVPMEQ